MAQTVKNPPVQSLGWEDPLGEEMATHSSILAKKIPWIEEPGGLQSMGSQELDTTEYTYTVYRLSKKAKVNIFKAIVFPVIIYGCES